MQTVNHAQIKGRTDKRVYRQENVQIICLFPAAILCMNRCITGSQQTGYRLITDTTGNTGAGALVFSLAGGF
jgi:hypothetical protein